MLMGKTFKELGETTRPRDSQQKKKKKKKERKKENQPNSRLSHSG